jgi:predicted Fe-S protein YdhL (DUF1289 family)
MCGSEITLKPTGLSAADLRLLKQSERVLLSQDAPSPCVSVCQMSDSTQLCVGCWRTLDEIAAWASLSLSDKRAVWQKVSVRLKADTTVK